MATFSVRLADELATRFDRAAASEGGRSALLRRLVLAAAASSSSTLSTGQERRGATRIMVRLTAADGAAVDAEAAAFGLSSAGWVAALVRRRVRGAASFSRPDVLTLNLVQSELRRIGVNINQIARAMNTAVLEGRVLELELQSLLEFRAELRAHLTGLRGALAGDLEYWDAGW